MARRNIDGNRARATPPSPTFLRHFRDHVLPPATTDLRSFFDALTERAAREFRAESCVLLDNNPYSRTLTVESVYPRQMRSRLRPAAPRSGTLSGVSVRHGDSSWHAAIRLLDGVPIAPTSADEPVQYSLLSLPVFSPWSPTLVHFVLDLYFLPGRVPRYDRGSPECYWLTTEVAHSVDYLLYKHTHRIRLTVERQGASAAGVASLFDRIVEELRSTLPCRDVTLYILSDNGETFAPECTTADSALCAESVAASAVAESSFCPHDMERSLRRRRPYLWYPHPADSRLPPVPGNGGGAAVVVPLLDGASAVIGALRCDQALDHARAFTSVDVSLLDAFARPMGTFIERFVRLRQRSDLTDVLKSVASAASATDALEDVLPLVIESVTKAFRAEVGSIFLWDESSCRLIMRAAAGRNAHLVGTAQYKLNEGITGTIPARGVINFRSYTEAQQHPSWLGKYNEAIWGSSNAAPVRTFLGCRIAWGDSLLGVWKIANMTPSADHPDPYFTDEDVELAQVLSTFLAYVIESVGRDARATRRLTFITNSILSIMAADQEDEAIKAGMAALEVSGFPNAMLSVYDASANEIVGALAAGHKWAPIVAMTRRRADGDDILAIVVRTGEAVFIPDSRMDSRCHAGAIAAGGIVAQYIIPLAFSGEIIGTIQIDFGTNTYISEQEETLLTGFARCLSIAIAHFRAARRLADLTETVSGGSRFIVAETLAGMVVHSLGHRLDDFSNALDGDLRKPAIRENRLLLDTLKKWKATVAALEKEVRTSLDFVRSPQSAGVGVANVHDSIQRTVDTWIVYINNHRCAVEHRNKAVKTSARIPIHCFRELLSVLIVNSVQAHAKHIHIETYNADNVSVGPRHFIRHALCVEVADDGVGVTCDKPEELFGPRFTTKPDKYGTGLGLFIARGLARAGGGELEWVPDARARGALFRITLPVSESEG